MDGVPGDPSIFQGELASGERILWQGQPDPKRHLAPADAFLVPFSLLWGGFAVFAGAGLAGWGDGLDVPSTIAAVIFPVIGLYFIVGRFVFKARRKRRTHYAVTDRRVIALERTWRGQRLQAAFIDLIPTVNKRVRRDGSGTIIFGNRSMFAQMYENTGMEVLGFGPGEDTSVVAFFDLPKVPEVADLVQRLRQGRDRPPPETQI